MGGFVLDTKESGEEVYVPGSPKVTLTPRGLLLMACLDHITDILPGIGLKTIKDRSKSDNFAKGLVCVQAGWLIVQCFSGIVGHLSVTLLEINTIRNVLCALVMYALWWSKPLNVLDPKVLTGSWARPLCALMCMDSDIYQSSNMGLPAGSRLERFEMNGLTSYLCRKVNLDWYMHVMLIKLGGKKTLSSKTLCLRISCG